MRNNPRFANNSMLQQSLDTLRSNPEVVNQLSQAMSDPNVRDRMATMMPQQRKRPGGSTNPFGNSPEEMRRQIEQFQRMSQRHGGTSGGFDAGRGGGANDDDGNALGGGGDRWRRQRGEATEEEMIAELVGRDVERATEEERKKFSLGSVAPSR